MQLWGSSVRVAENQMSWGHGWKKWWERMPIYKMRTGSCSFGLLWRLHKWIPTIRRSVSWIWRWIQSLTQTQTVGNEQTSVWIQHWEQRQNYPPPPIGEVQQIWIIHSGKIWQRWCAEALGLYFRHNIDIISLLPTIVHRREAGSSTVSSHLQRWRGMPRPTQRVEYQWFGTSYELTRNVITKFKSWW